MDAEVEIEVEITCMCTFTELCHAIQSADSVSVCMSSLNAAAASLGSDTRIVIVGPSGLVEPTQIVLDVLHVLYQPQNIPIVPHEYNKSRKPG